MRKEILFWIIGLFLISLVSAETVYQRDTVVDFKYPCFNNNTFCSDSSTCNMTVEYPNSSIMINNLQMDNQGAYHNQTLNLIINGRHDFTVICEDSGSSGFKTSYFFFFFLISS